MRPVRVTVITYAPTVFRHCQHCEVAFQGVGLGERLHRDEARDALPADLAVEFEQVSDWVHGLIERHGPQVAVDVVDAASVEGILKSVRHRVRRYPAVIIDGRERRVGQPDFAELDRLVQARVAAGHALGGAA
jgi:hypothetical protein